MEWIKYTISYIRRNLSVFLLLLLICIAVFLYKVVSIRLELIALVFSPLFTLSVLPIIEEYKSKWNSKYETFKLLYSNRNNLVNYNVVQHLNMIDIVFLHDAKVRKCWKELRKTLNTSCTYLEQNAKYAELISAMAVSLGLNKNISYTDIIDAYYPNGLANMDENFNKKNLLEIDLYDKALTYIDNYMNDKNSKE